MPSSSSVDTWNATTPSCRRKTVTSTSPDAPPAREAAALRKAVGPPNCPLWSSGPDHTIHQVATLNRDAGRVILEFRLRPKTRTGVAQPWVWIGGSHDRDLVLQRGHRGCRGIRGTPGAGVNPKAQTAGNRPGDRDRDRQWSVGPGVGQIRPPRPGPGARRVGVLAVLGRTGRRTRAATGSAAATGRTGVCTLARPRSIARLHSRCSGAGSLPPCGRDSAFSYGPRSGSP